MVTKERMDEIRKAVKEIYHLQIDKLNPNYISLVYDGAAIGSDRFIMIKEKLGLPNLSITWMSACIAPGIILVSNL